ncbi:Placenta specific 8 [Schistosoma japonicum]|nr:Placenta specific 8 [Schistosoma japonicum]
MMTCCCRSNQKNHERNYKQWNTYAISCCENCSNCWCCLCCCPFATAEIYHYTWSLPWSIALIFSILLLPLNMLIILLQRMQIRRAHKLEGNCLSDLCCLICCCWPTIICQLRDEILYLRSQSEWKLGYSHQLDDKPPWLKPFFKLKKQGNNDVESANISGYNDDAPDDDDVADGNDKVDGNDNDVNDDTDDDDADDDHISDDEDDANDDGSDDVDDYDADADDSNNDKDTDSNDSDNMEEWEGSENYVYTGVSDSGEAEETDESSTSIGNNKSVLKNSEDEDEV